MDRPIAEDHAKLSSRSTMRSHADKRQGRSEGSASRAVVDYCRSIPTSPLSYAFSDSTIAATVAAVSSKNM